MSLSFKGANGRGKQNVLYPNVRYTVLAYAYLILYKYMYIGIAKAVI